MPLAVLTGDPGLPTPDEIKTAADPLKAAVGRDDEPLAAEICRVALERRCMLRMMRPPPLPPPPSPGNVARDSNPLAAPGQPNTKRPRPCSTVLLPVNIHISALPLFASWPLWSLSPAPGNAAVAAAASPAATKTLPFPPTWNRSDHKISAANSMAVRPAGSSLSPPKSSSSSASSSSASSSSSSSSAGAAALAALPSLPPSVATRAARFQKAFTVKPGDGKAKKRKRKHTSVTVDDASALVTEITSGARGADPRLLGPLCAKMGVANWGDNWLHAICKSLANKGLSHNNALVFAAHALLPRFRALARPASRSLVNATVVLATVQPRAVVHAVILPVVCGSTGGSSGVTASSSSSASPSSSSNHVASIACIELASRVSKTMSPGAVHEFLAQLFVDRSGGGAAGRVEGACRSGGLQVSDAALGLIKSLLSIRGVVLSPSHVADLTGWFERCQKEAAGGGKPAKLASAVHTMIAKHSMGVAPHKARLERLVIGLDTFMTKSSVAMLRKL